MVTSKLAGKGDGLFIGRYHFVFTIEEIPSLERPEDLGHQAKDSNATLADACEKKRIKNIVTFINLNVIIIYKTNHLLSSSCGTRRA
jgi:hypothetical protein